eukprot:TRINITY_DN727_c2_g1_i1.p1 TRINITY_DN727_c2_g1~~TRINITY_DN727_c2_g1_i1.p1  ORF type:complete len:175 (-),score=60.09 TRINITY_DN727_c2_g1_i1:104-628(-)
MAHLYRSLFGGLLDDDEPTPSLIYQSGSQLEPQLELQSNFKLYLGNLPDSQNKVKLINLNIKYVINMITDQNPYINLGLGHIHFKGFNTIDLENYQMTQHFNEAIEFINQAKQNNDGCLLVHCAAGVSRSATIVCAYLMNQCQMDFEQAIQFLKSKRNCICPNIGFLNQLQSFS